MRCFDLDRMFLKKMPGLYMYMEWTQKIRWAKKKRNEVNWRLWLFLFVCASGTKNKIFQNFFFVYTDDLFKRFQWKVRQPKPIIILLCLCRTIQKKCTIYCRVLGVNVMQASINKSGLGWVLYREQTKNKQQQQNHYTLYTCISSKTASDSRRTRSTSS